MGRSLQSFFKDLDRGIKQSFYKKTMKEIGELAIDTIVERTRSGYGVQKTGATSRRFKPLSSSYIEYRRRKREKLDSTTNAAKSNLTFTGRMLRSMKVKEVSNNRVTWGPSNDLRKGGVTNAEIGQFVAEQGRPFNYLSKQDIENITKYASKILQAELRRL